MTKPNALIVEDDPGLGEVFSITLKDMFETEICSSGIVALTRLGKLIPAIVVLDLHLPGASGNDILKYIKSNDRFSKTRVILCTADAHEANILQDEVDIVLLKPVSPNQLRELASRMLVI
jgi:two-component system, NtrC family, response regulator HydG